MEMGPVEQDIARQAYTQGQPLPDRIANAPELRLGLELYLQAFYDLDSERSHGMGLTQISWSSIKGYADVNDFDQLQTDNLFVFIRAMDTEHLKRLDERSK